MKIIRLKKGLETTIIQEAVKTLNQNGLIIYPTETCYGIGAESNSPKAVAKLLDFKGRAKGKAISVAVSDQDMAKKYVEFNNTAKNLYKNFLPGPLTVISHSLGKVDPRLETIHRTLGVRIPAYPLILKIIKIFGRPITSTSANSSGKKPPYSLSDFKKYTSLKKQKLVNLFIDAGKLPHRPPSSVVNTTLNEPKMLRLGEINLEQIKSQVWLSNSEKETQIMAQKIFFKYQHLLKKQPLIFALQGELGAGKTQFVKGLAQALGIKTNITSPTFIFLKEYSYSKGMLYHLDTWRMQNSQDLLALGLKKMLEPGNIIAIEWLQKVKLLLEKLKLKIVWIDLKYIALNKRQIIFSLK